MLRMDYKIVWWLRGRSTLVSRRLSTNAGGFHDMHTSAHATYLEHSCEIFDGFAHRVTSQSLNDSGEPISVPVACVHLSKIIRQQDGIVIHRKETPHVFTYWHRRFWGDMVSVTISCESKWQGNHVLWRRRTAPFPTNRTSSWRAEHSIISSPCSKHQFNQISRCSSVTALPATSNLLPTHKSTEGCIFSIKSSHTRNAKKLSGTVISKTNTRPCKDTTIVLHRRHPRHERKRIAFICVCHHKARQTSQSWPLSSTDSIPEGSSATMCFSLAVKYLVLISQMSPSHAIMLGKGRGRSPTSLAASVRLPAPANM